MEVALVVEQICKCLDVPTLKSVRQINRLWREEAVKELLLKGFIQVPPGYHKRTLGQRCKDRSALFNLLHPEFFNSDYRRRKVKNIRISRFEDIAPLNTLGILQGDVKHLQVSRDIYLDTNHPDKEAVSEILGHVLTDHLTSLESFTFYPDFHGIKDLGFFIKMEKCHLIKTLALQPRDFFITTENDDDNNNNNDSPHNLETLIKNLEKFSSGSHRLTSILLGHGNKLLEREEPAIFSRYIRCLNKILESSKDSIKTLEISDTFSSIPNFRMPILTSLTTLNAVVPSAAVHGNVSGIDVLDIEMRASRPIFPGNFKAKQVNIFPQLRRMTIGIVEKYEYFCAWKLCFRPIYCFNTPSPASLKRLLPMLKFKVDADDIVETARSFFSNLSHPSLPIFNPSFVKCPSHRFFVSPPDSTPFHCEKTLMNRINEIQYYQLTADRDSDEASQDVLNDLFVISLCLILLFIGAFLWWIYILVEGMSRLDNAALYAVL